MLIKLSSACCGVIGHLNHFKATLAPLEDLTENTMLMEQCGSSYVQMVDGGLVLQLIWKQSQLSV
jgi:hypothetical protein